MDNMRKIEDDISSELEYLNKYYSADVSAKVLEMTQKEIHHRENMRAINTLTDAIGELKRVLERQKG